MPTDVGKKALDAVNFLDQTYFSAQQEVADLNLEIINLKTQISKIKPGILSLFGGNIPNIAAGLDRLNWKYDTDHDIKIRPHGVIYWSKDLNGWTTTTIQPAGDWDNFYNHYDGIGPQLQATRFAWYGEFMLPTSGDYAGCQALETQIEQCIGGTTFDTNAWQFPLGGGKPFSKFLRYFDKVKKWLDSPIPFDPSLLAPGNIVSMLSEGHVDHDAKQVFYDALTLNGLRTELNLVVSPGINQWNSTVNYLQFAFQQDPVKSASYVVKIRNFICFYM